MKRFHFIKVVPHKSSTLLKSCYILLLTFFFIYVEMDTVIFLLTHYLHLFLLFRAIFLLVFQLAILCLTVVGAEIMWCFLRLDVSFSYIFSISLTKLSTKSNLRNGIQKIIYDYNWLQQLFYKSSVALHRPTVHVHDISRPCSLHWANFVMNYKLFTH